MTFELTPEHEQFRRTVRDFAEKEIAPHSAEWDRTHHFPVDVVHKMGELGLFGLTAPEEYGGAGLGGEEGGFTSLCLAIEELGRVDQSIGITLEAAVGLGINPILTYGTEEQKQTWLPDLVAGRRLAGFGLTEPGAGSDAGATRTRARLDGGEWVVNGSKAFITNSGTDITSVVTVTARTGENPDGSAQISTILIPSGTTGLTVEPPYEKLGWHASDTHGLSFADCRVPADNLLGEQGAGYKQFLKTLDDGRIAISALAVGLAQACLEASISFCSHREQFGRPIGGFQLVQQMVVEIATLTETSRLLGYKAARVLDAGEPGRFECSMAKYYCGESAGRAATLALQVHGGAGLMEESPVERYFRDAREATIPEGTSQIQILHLGRALLGISALR